MSPTIVAFSIVLFQLQLPMNLNSDWNPVFHLFIWCFFFRHFLQQKFWNNDQTDNDLKKTLPWKLQLISPQNISINFLKYKNWVSCVVEIRAWILDVTSCEFSSSFPPLHLTIWTICSKCKVTPTLYWTLGQSPFGLSKFVSVIIRGQKGLMEKDYLENLCCGFTKSIHWKLISSLSDLMRALHVLNNWLFITNSIN